MRRMIYSSIAKLSDEPVELFWLAGLFRDDKNDWRVLGVFRGRETGRIFKLHLPIGVLPILSLGTWFDHGLLKREDALGVDVEVAITNMAEYDIITSADIPTELYPLPEGKAGTQRLLRYRVGGMEVVIPVIELVRSMFVHNRALAIALMRPGGIEQLYSPQTPGYRETAQIRFTKEMATSAIGTAFVQEFGWMVLDSQARRAWDSVQQLSDGHAYVLFEPPAIRESMWSFRGVRHGNQWLVLELKSFSGRRLPFGALEYSHPCFRKAVLMSSDKNISNGGKPQPPGSGKDGESVDKDFDVDQDGEGSTSYRGAKAIDAVVRRPAFENKVFVRKEGKEVERTPGKLTSKLTKSHKSRRTKVIQVTTGERAGTGKLAPLEFKMLAPAPGGALGDLDALDETVRHMRDMLKDVHFGMSLVQLKQGRAIASAGRHERAAMVVVITPKEKPQIVLLDVERTGIVALSLMAMHFEVGASPVNIEEAVKRMLDGWVDVSGHWSSAIEEELAVRCQCERIPKILIPREKSAQHGKWWAKKLIERLGLPQ